MSEQPPQPSKPPEPPQGWPPPPPQPSQPPVWGTYQSPIQPGPPVPPHVVYQQAPAAQNGLGVTSLLLGLGSVLFFWVPILGLLAYVTSITGIVTGAYGIGRAKRGLASNLGVATAGVVLSVAGLIAVIAFTVFWGFVIADSAST